MLQSLRAILLLWRPCICRDIVLSWLLFGFSAPLPIVLPLYSISFQLWLFLPPPSTSDSMFCYLPVVSPPPPFTSCLSILSCHSSTHSFHRFIMFNRSIPQLVHVARSWLVLGVIFHPASYVTFNDDLFKIIERFRCFELLIAITSFQ